MKTLLSLFLLITTQQVIAEEVVHFTVKQRLAMQIETSTVPMSDTSTSASLPGEVVVPNAQLHVVTAPQQGLVETLLVAEGESVTQGQPLARIESPALLALQSEYLEIYTRYKLAKSNYERDLKLKNEGIIAERRLLASEAKFQELVTALSRVKRLLELAGLDNDALTQLRSSRQLDSTLVVAAPFSGVVLEQITTAGNRVDAADPLYRIAKLKPLWIEVHVPLEQLANVFIGQKIFLPSLNISGDVITIGKMVHGADQGVLVRARIDEGAEILRPGQFLQVQLSVAWKQGNYRVPRSAVVRSGGNSYIFAEQTDGFLPIRVRVVAEEADELIIDAEIPTQAPIAVAGTAAIKAAWLGGE